MQEKKIHSLKICKEFKDLIRPLRHKELLQLEENLLADGCRDPIVTWNGYIVDGHNRYELCRRHAIPFAVVEKGFQSKEEAIAWICANQLGRRNITEETRKFLIGMQYESEKIVLAQRNAKGKNQYSVIEEPDQDDDEKKSDGKATSRHWTALRIAEQNNISPGTVQKYANYTRALEVIGKKVPLLVPKILSGSFKISHNNIVELSRLPPDEIKKVTRKLELSQKPIVRYNKTRQEIQNSMQQASAAETPAIPSVKDMPAFDPDAEITGLTLTIPSWTSSIERTKTKADLSIVSSNARNKLTMALQELQAKVQEMLVAIEED